ncbi:MAG: superoxide dismutase [Ni] [Planctomycetota bacterium]|jgi:nickel superoxide dismutase
MKKRRSTKFLSVSVLLAAVIFASMAYSHCQIPCGIYGDQGRFDMLSEHIITIEKSMNTINELSKQDNPDMNQIVRWVQNKDKHADELTDIVTYYFLAQRVKPPQTNEGKEYEAYVKKLTSLHQMMVHSMKAKQTTDLQHVEKLRTLLSQFHEVYTAK